MNRKVAVLSMLLLVSLGISSVSAIVAYLDVSPKRVPIGGTVTLYIENRFETSAIMVDKIEVTCKDTGIVYVKSLGVSLAPGANLSEDFGTGVSGWTPTADTSSGGKYLVHIVGPDSPVEAYFDVSSMFAVPEFTVPSVLAVAACFALLFSLRRTKIQRV